MGPDHCAVVVFAAFGDDLSVLNNRFGCAVNGVFHQRVEHAARADLTRGLPRGGEAFGARTAAQAVHRAGVVPMAFAAMVTLPLSASNWMKVRCFKSVRPFHRFAARGTGVKSNRASRLASI